MSNIASWFVRGALILAAVVAPPFFGGAQAGDHHHSPHRLAGEDECVCESAESSNGWCDACGVGYVASLRIPSALMFEILDPHGHEVDLSDVACLACHAAMESDGFCETHRIGYVEGRGYVTRLTYLLARGEPVKASEEYSRLRTALRLLKNCEYCALAAFANGRCPKCDIHYRDGKKVSTTTKRASR